MSKSSRNQPVAFPSDAPAIEAESTVAASETPETPESAPEALAEAPLYEGINAEMIEKVIPLVESSYARINAKNEVVFIPQKVESMSSQHELAQHIAELLAEEGAEMAIKPEVEEESDVDIEAELSALAGSTLVQLPDGSIRATVIVPAEMVPVLKEWANGADENFESYLQRTMDMALSAVVLGGAVAG